jgi:imidazoleglycerol phosphate synthase glutamine amidotransferase subunit HisH
VTTVAVVDYKVGNIFSMTTALQRVAFNVEVTADPIRLRAADAIIQVLATGRSHPTTFNPLNP